MRHRPASRKILCRRAPKSILKHGDKGVDRLVAQLGRHILHRRTAGQFPKRDDKTQLLPPAPERQARLPDHQAGERPFAHVASVQPGSGTAFSLLPAENATGNYVKIVQRVPVKITLDGPPESVVLGPGMSVEPTVRINPAQTLLERLEAVL